MVPQAKFARGIVWEFLDTAGGDKIATHVFKAQYILGQEANSYTLGYGNTGCGVFKREVQI